MNNADEAYISEHSKSQFIDFLLTLLFGHLGLFYSTWVAALILCAAAIALAALVGFLGTIFCWIIAILISLFVISNHNKKARATENLFLSK